MMPTLRLVPYDPTWPRRFDTEAVRLRHAVGAHVLAIEHVGSTAVPGLLAKPVIDIAIAVASAHDATLCIAPMERLGYVHRGPHGDDPQRRYFVRDVAGRRDIQVHLYIQPAPAYAAQLRFRDVLRADPALAAAYADEKRRIADLVGWDKVAYAEAKAPFVQRALAGLRPGRGL